jgi:uncharacterized protein
MRWLRRLVVVVVLVAFALDASRAPADQVSVRFALAGIRLYRVTLAPLLGVAGLSCRFTPTCSHYAEAVIARDGIVRGTWLAARRIARCGPWTAAGTTDLP